MSSCNYSKVLSTYTPPLYSIVITDWHHVAPPNVNIECFALYTYTRGLILSMTALAVKTICQSELLRRCRPLFYYCGTIGAFSANDAVDLWTIHSSTRCWNWNTCFGCDISILVTEWDPWRLMAYDESFLRCHPSRVSRIPPIHSSAHFITYFIHLGIH